MINENEIITLALGLGVYIFISAYKVQLKQIPHWKIILLAYHIILAAFALTILEGFFLENAINTLEHLCYAISMAVLTLWCWKITFASRGSEK